MALRQDPHLDIRLALVLLTGSLIGMIITLAGLLLFFARHPETLSVVDETSLPFSQIMSQVMDGRSLAIIDLGLIAFMLTPILRVIMAIYQFWREGDRRYALISFGVLCVLTVSLIIARG